MKSVFVFWQDDKNAYFSLMWEMITALSHLPVCLPNQLIWTRPKKPLGSTDVHVLTVLLIYEHVAEVSKRI